MFALTAFVWVICTVAIAQRSDDYQIKFATHANMSCQPNETRCALGCCPFPDATCCIDGFECCRSGQICIPIIGVCMGVVNSENEELSLESSKSTRVRNLITTCPSGTTECGEDRCCSYPDATCCSDGIHCCPYGYGCDIRNAVCIRSSSNYIIPMLYKMIYTPAAKVVKKLSYKSCPANDKICPMDSNCCITENEQWDCCPNPTTLNRNKYDSKN